MILEYIKKVVGIALTTPSSTLVDWSTVKNTPNYQRKGYEFSCESSHKTSLGERRINWYANPTLVIQTKADCLHSLKHPRILPRFKKIPYKLKDGAKNF